jgi:hypothetical protein
MRAVPTGVIAEQRDRAFGAGGRAMKRVGSLRSKLLQHHQEGRRPATLAP